MSDSDRRGIGKWGRSGSKSCRPPVSPDPVSTPDPVAFEPVAPSGRNSGPGGHSMQVGHSSTKRYNPPTVKLPIPDPEKDFGTYRRFDEMLRGVSEILEARRRLYGVVGHGTRNASSDLSKGIIEAVMRGDYVESDRLAEDFTLLRLEFERQEIPLELHDHLPEGRRGALPDMDSSQFEKDVGQEYVEAMLFRSIWPVVLGEVAEMPRLPTMRELGLDVPETLAGIVDVVSEMSKALASEMIRSDLATDEEFEILRRFITIAESIDQRIGEERHAPGYVINNAYGRWNAFTNKLRNQVQNSILRAKDNLGVRMSFKRMIQVLPRA